MSYTSGFFDAVDLGGGEYDREYSAAVFAHYFSLLVKNGVFPDPSTGMQVKASSSPDMHVSVQPGSGWINGYYITVPDDSPEVLTVPIANPSLSRIDSVIMGLNYVEREIQLYIKPGAVSASPIPVSLQRDNDLYELELAQISVSAGVASIVQANITDMRTNTSRCGIVKGTIEQIDTTDLFAQYDDAFQTWFADIQAQLSGDVATNLQSQINELKSGKSNTVHEHSASDITSGTLPVSRGGTGNSTGLAASATKLATARTIKVNLASTAAPSFDGTANLTPGVSGTLPLGNGGTGQTSLSGLVSALNSGGLVRVTTGTYTGTGTASVSITVGFAAKMIIVLPVTNAYTADFESSSTFKYTWLLGVKGAGACGFPSYSNATEFTFSSTGVSWRNSLDNSNAYYFALNYSKITYTWIALG